MAKPVPLRLLLPSYPLQSEVQTRYCDTDALHHLNNVSIAAIYEDARFALTTRLFGPLAARGTVRMLIAAIEINYLREGRYPGMLQAGCGVAQLGRSSLVVGQALFQDGSCIGIADTTIVYTDAGRATPIPPALRAEMEAYVVPAVAADIRLEAGT